MEAPEAAVAAGEYPDSAGEEEAYPSNNRWHLDCFRCNQCHTLLDSDADLLLLDDGSLICNNCTYSCSACGNKIEDLAILTGDQAFCATCFRCRNCKRKIENLRYARTSQGIFCMSCHESLMARRRKKSKLAAAAANAKEKDSMLVDKSLPALPPSEKAAAEAAQSREPPMNLHTELSPRPRPHAEQQEGECLSEGHAEPVGEKHEGTSPNEPVDPAHRVPGEGPHDIERVLRVQQGRRRDHEDTTTAPSPGSRCTSATASPALGGEEPKRQHLANSMSNGNANEKAQSAQEKFKLQDVPKRKRSNESRNSGKTEAVENPQARPLVKRENLSRTESAESTRVSQERPRGGVNQYLGAESESRPSTDSAMSPPPRDQARTELPTASKPIPRKEVGGSKLGKTQPPSYAASDAMSSSVSSTDSTALSTPTVNGKSISSPVIKPSEDSAP
ncbi:hypothetical protein VE04_09982, partial [Pseudogymnoascus sp. 24MN13]